MGDTLYRCALCGYGQDLEMTEEAVKIHFPEIKDLEAGQCPQCRALLSKVEEPVPSPVKSLEAFYSYWERKLTELFLDKDISKEELRTKYWETIRAVGETLVEAQHLESMPTDSFIESYFNATSNGYETLSGDELLKACSQGCDSFKRSIKHQFGKKEIH